jgi:predicted dehydrogenase
LEKPITPTVKEAEGIVKEADKAGAKVLIGHHRAHSPIMARAKEVIDEGRSDNWSP